MVTKPASEAQAGESGTLYQPGTLPPRPPPGSWVRLASPCQCLQQPSPKAGCCVLRCLCYINLTTLIKTICGSP